MKWTVKQKRIIKWFALFPYRINDEVHWLETVYIQQHRWFHIGTQRWIWEDDRFVARYVYEAYKENKN